MRGGLWLGDLGKYEMAWASICSVAFSKLVLCGNVILFRALLDELVQGCMEWAMERDMPVLVEGSHYGGHGNVKGALVHFTLYALPEKVGAMIESSSHGSGLALFHAICSDPHTFSLRSAGCTTSVTKKQKPSLFRTTP